MTAESETLHPTAALSEGHSASRKAATVAAAEPAQEAAPQVATPERPQLDPEALLALISAKLDDDKAEDIISIDLRGKTAIADFMVIASGRSQRHVGAVADHLIEALKEVGVRHVRVEGQPACDWVLIDAGDIIVHVFQPEVRVFYNIEKMWAAPSRA